MRYNGGIKAKEDKMRQLLAFLCVLCVLLTSKVDHTIGEEGVDVPIDDGTVEVTDGVATLPPPASTTTEATTAPPPTEENPRNEVLICLDAGHGLIDPGAVATQNGTAVYEKDLNLRVALLTQARLEAMGYRVLMIRTGDTSLLGGSDRGASYKTTNEAIARRELAKKAGVSLYISVHCNAYAGENRAYGPLVFYNSSSATTYRALSLSRTFSARFTELNRGYSGAKDCEVRAGDSYIVLRELSMPALLLELGFMTDKSDLALLTSDTWQKGCADAIAKGVEDAFLAGLIE